MHVIELVVCKNQGMRWGCTFTGYTSLNKKNLLVEDLLICNYNFPALHLYLLMLSLYQLGLPHQVVKRERT